MPVLLTIDLQGGPERWQQGGHAAAAALFDDFHDLVLDTSGSMDVASQITGELDGDWCALICPSIESALALGRRIFRRAWLESRSSDDLRLWLRGVIAPIEDGAVRFTSPDEELKSIRRTTASPGVQRGLAALRSGFTGMRLLVDEELLSDPLRGMFRVPLGRLGLIPFRRMNFTPYPATLKKTFQDFLWMAETPHEWNNYLLRMKQRTLWSANNPTEFLHAAASQTVFCEVDAIIQSVVRKNQSRGDERPSRPLARESRDARESREPREPRAADSAQE